MSTVTNSAPIDSTCSATSGRTSKARTIAPIARGGTDRREACHTGADHEDPRRRESLPAAVTWPVNWRPNAWAASTTAR